MRGFAMSQQIGSQVISRRKLFLLVGLAASFAVPATALTASNAMAQQPGDQTPGKNEEKQQRKEERKAERKAQRKEKRQEEKTEKKQNQ
jgi:hypothetical protein